MNSKSSPVQLGVLAGIIAIIISLAQFLFFSDKIGQGGFSIMTVISFLSFAILVYFMFKAANDMKVANGGFLDFKHALKSSYVVAIVATLISFLFGLVAKFLLFPKVYDQINERSIEKTIEKMEAQGVSEEAIEQSIKMTEKILDISIWLFLPLALIIYFFIALIIAAIVQKKRAL